MPLIGTIISFLASTVGRYVLVGVGVVALVGGFAMREQKKGAEKLATKIEANNAAVTSKAATAARKSTDDAAPGVRNPRYRAD